MWDLSNVERRQGHTGTLITDTKSIVTGIRTGGHGGGTNGGRRPNNQLIDNDALLAVHKTGVDMV